MTDTDRTLLVLVFSLIGIGYFSCHLAVELYREAKIGYRRRQIRKLR